MLEEWIRNWKSDDVEKSVLKGRGKYIMAAVICLGILALLWPAAKSDIPEVTTASSGSGDKNGLSINERMSTELQGILAKISGAGRVEVSLTLASDGLKTYATNDRKESRTIEEKDARGSNKVTSEENATHDLAAAGNSPLLLEVRTPEVIGVLVVADGAGDAVVRENLAHATATLLNIPLYKVRVMPGEERI